MIDSCDILVVGAGVSGVPAAVAAARLGADTRLIEQAEFPGGAGVTALHRHICGAHGAVDPNRPDEPGAPLNAGLTAEILARLARRSPESIPRRMGRVFVTPYDPADFQAVCEALIAGERRLRAHFGVRLTRVNLDARRLLSITASSGERAVEIRCRVAIDCTGTGTLIEQAGATQPETLPERRQLAGYSIRLTGVRDTPGVPLEIHVPHVLRQASGQGLFPPHLQFTQFIPGRTPSDALIKFSLPAGDTDPDAARGLAIGAHRHLVAAIPALAESSIAGFSPRVHEREGLRLLGRYTLTADDVLESRSFADSAAVNAWPIEHWHPLTGPRLQYPASRQPGHIPLRCLQSTVIDNLMAAGRCISATPEALASTRVMGPCMALGEAAGTAAAAGGNSL